MSFTKPLQVIFKATREQLQDLIVHVIVASGGTPPKDLTELDRLIDLDVAYGWCIRLEMWQCKTLNLLIYKKGDLLYLTHDNCLPFTIVRTSWIGAYPTAIDLINAVGAEVVEEKQGGWLWLQ